MDVLRGLLVSPVARALIDSGKLVRTVELPSTETKSLAIQSPVGDGRNLHVVEHERIWFPSYPYEWPAEMLFAAGELTLEVAELSLDDGFSLKDATPYNILFLGPKPIFIDVLSFEKRVPGDMRWLPYAQFVRMFLLPLLMDKTFGIKGADVFLSHRDGLEPEDIYQLTTWAQRLRPPFLTTVSIPAWLGRRMNPDDKKLYQDAKLTAPEKADFVLRSQLRRARRLLQRLRPAEDRTSNWSAYGNTLSYQKQEFEQKSDLVREWLQKVRPQALLDVGCNAGHFSQIAAETGARVIAIDLDPVVVGMTWHRAVANSLDILPLVVNLARPTPATGWRNAEYASFLDRASGSFDAVIMLAVIHHMLVTERIPLIEIVGMCQRLANRHLIIEFVSSEDEMFQRLTRGRESLHADFTQQAFETAFAQGFTIREKVQVKGNLRWLYLLERIEG